MFFILIRHEIHKYIYNDNETRFEKPHFMGSVKLYDFFLHSTLRKVTIKMGLENYAYLRADSHKKSFAFENEGQIYYTKFFY